MLFEGQCLCRSALQALQPRFVHDMDGYALIGVSYQVQRRRGGDVGAQTGWKGGKGIVVAVLM